MIRAVERKVIIPALSEKAAPEVGELHKALLQLAEAHNYHDDQINRALRGGVSDKNSSSVKHVNLTVQMPTEPPWRLHTMKAPWAAFGAGFDAAAYLMEPGGHVSNRGLITGGTPSYTGGGTGVFASFPTAGYAPGNEKGWACEGGNDAAVGKVGFLRAQPSGDLLAVSSSAVSPPYFFLDVMTWIAPNAAPPHPFLAPWPIIVRHDFVQCVGLVVERCREETQSARTTCGAPVVDWDDVGDGTLRVKGIWGLAWGKKYTLGLRLSAREDD